MRVDDSDLILNLFVHNALSARIRHTESGSELSDLQRHKAPLEVVVDLVGRPISSVPFSSWSRPFWAHSRRASNRDRRLARRWRVNTPSRYVVQALLFLIAASTCRHYNYRSARQVPANTPERSQPASPLRPAPAPMLPTMSAEPLRRRARPQATSSCALACCGWLTVS